MRYFVPILLLTVLCSALLQTASRPSVILVLSEVGDSKHREIFESVLARHAEYDHSIVYDVYEADRLLVVKKPQLVVIDGEEYYYAPSETITSSEETMQRFLDNWKAHGRPWRRRFGMKEGELLHGLVVAYAMPLARQYYAAPSWLVLAISLTAGSILRRSLFGGNRTHPHAE